MQKNREHTLQGVSTEIIDTAQKLYALIIYFELMASEIQSFDTNGQSTQVYWYRAKGSEAVIECKVEK